MPVHGCVKHAWAFVGQGTHFEIIPNSRFKPRMVHKVACDCGQRGFKYKALGAILTWPADEAQWATEVDHEAAQARKSPFARARRP